jgi:hypothetical protein
VNGLYTIVGTVRIDSPPNRRSCVALDDSSLEQLLLRLTVADSLNSFPGRLSKESIRTANSQRAGTRVHADLEVLAAELQSEWQDLEAARQ